MKLEQYIKYCEENKLELPAVLDERFDDEIRNKLKNEGIL